MQQSEHFTAKLMPNNRAFSVLPGSVPNPYSVFLSLVVVVLNTENVSITQYYQLDKELPIFLSREFRQKRILPPFSLPLFHLFLNISQIGNNFLTQ